MASNKWELSMASGRSGRSTFDIDDDFDAGAQVERRKMIRRTMMDRRKEFRFDPSESDRRKNPGRRKEDRVWAGAYDL